MATKKPTKKTPAPEQLEATTTADAGGAAEQLDEDTVAQLAELERKKEEIKSKGNKTCKLLDKQTGEVCGEPLVAHDSGVVPRCLVPGHA